MLTRRQEVDVILLVFPPTCLKNLKAVRRYIPTRGDFSSPALPGTALR